MLLICCGCSRGSEEGTPPPSLPSPFRLRQSAEPSVACTVPSLPVLCQATLAVLCCPLLF
ncbi:hypothetical protein E2C01_028607 [Portunus trituberculatus]|uniref:Uncharacterized protein n=1 Tax=Portunus trituberculatus TaxID=210409 RepID=A0A5B7EPX2_PORTR|nr:hypothetical protein [Portunus trituberculatus]